MCEYRDDCYVVPKKRSAAMGWWLGQIVSGSGRFLTVYVIRSQFPISLKEGATSCTKESVDVFGDFSEAFRALRERKALPADLLV